MENYLIQISDDRLQKIVTDAVKTAMSQKTTTSIPEPPIKGIHALGRFLGVGAARAQKLKNEGVFPYFQDGRLVLFDPDKVREAMAGHNIKRKNSK